MSYLLPDRSLSCRDGSLSQYVFQKVNNIVVLWQKGISTREWGGGELYATRSFERGRRCDNERQHTATIASLIITVERQSVLIRDHNRSSRTNAQGW